MELNSKKDIHLQKETWIIPLTLSKNVENLD